MQRFTDPIRACLRNEIWMPALTSAIVLPDICGWLETGEKSSGARYKAWAKTWIEPKYAFTWREPISNSTSPWRNKKVTLSASDLYALRCAMTHSGTIDITTQKAREILDSFVFCVPQKFGVVHRNVAGHVIQLQIDSFCGEICDAVDEWDKMFAADTEVQRRKTQLVSLRNLENYTV